MLVSKGRWSTIQERSTVQIQIDSFTGINDFIIHHLPQYCIGPNKRSCLNKRTPSSFWQPTPKFWWNLFLKQVKIGDKWAKTQPGDKYSINFWEIWGFCLNAPWRNMKSLHVLLNGKLKWRSRGEYGGHMRFRIVWVVTRPWSHNLIVLFSKECCYVISIRPGISQLFTNNRNGSCRICEVFNK